MTGGSRWCPSCGDEFEPWVVACDECDVDLVDSEPEVLVPVAPPEPDVIVTPPMRVEPDALTDAERAELLAHLEAAPIPHLVAEDGSITAVTGYEDDLDVALQRVRGGEDPSRLRYAEPLAEGRPLDAARRLVAIVLDGALAAAAVASVLYLGGGGAGALLVLAVVFVNHVVGLGERGLSIGKRLVGGRVRSTLGGHLSWSEATVRWLVRDGPVGLAVAISLAIEDPQGVWFVMQLIGGGAAVGIGASILIDLQRRGVHDFAVDSVVVSAVSLGNWPADGAKSGT